MINFSVRLASILFLSIAAVSIAHASPMSFTVIKQRTRDISNGITAEIYASGDIAKDTAKLFEETVKKNNIKDAVVYFNSTGGLVVESIKLAESIRAHGFGTSVQKREGDFSPKAMCASACVYAYAGGVARYLDDDKGRLGVHQYFAAKMTNSDDQKDDLKVAQLLGSVIVAHLQKMGVSTALYVAAAITDSQDMLWMGRKQAESFDLVNNGELPAEANLRLTDQGHPYLLVSQVADKGKTYILLSCGSDGIMFNGGALGEEGAMSQLRLQAVSSAIEIDGNPILTIQGQGGLKSASDQGIEISRKIDLATLGKVNKAKTLGFSVQGIGGKWSRAIDVSLLRDKIIYYTRICNKQG